MQNDTCRTVGCGNSLINRQGMRIKSYYCEVCFERRVVEQAEKDQITREQREKKEIGLMINKDYRDKLHVVRRAGISLTEWEDKFILQMLDKDAASPTMKQIDTLNTIYKDRVPDRHKLNEDGTDPFYQVPDLEPIFERAREFGESLRDKEGILQKKRGEVLDLAGQFIAALLTTEDKNIMLEECKFVGEDTNASTAIDLAYSVWNEIETYTQRERKLDKEEAEEEAPQPVDPDRDWFKS